MQELWYSTINMRCKNCRKQIDNDSKFCEHCGHTQLNDKDKTEEQKNLLWKEFDHSKNTDKILVLKAKALSGAVYDISITITKLLIDDAKSNKDFQKTLSEKEINDNFEDYFDNMFFLFMHITDRIAFGILGKEKRGLFIDALFLELREKLSKQVEGGLESARFREDFGNKWNAFQNEYGSYKLLPEKDEPYGNTVFWEFCKRIVSILKGKEPDILLMMVFTEYTTKGYVWLNIPQLLQDKRE